MKALTPEQLEEIRNFVQKYHGCYLYIREADRAVRKVMFPSLPDSHGFGIKYIDVCYDSRDGLYWYICFRGGRYGIQFSANHFTSLNPAPKGWKYNTMYDLCMAYLKGEFIPKKEFETDYQDLKPTRFEMIKKLPSTGGAERRSYFGVEFEEWRLGETENSAQYWICNGQRFEELEKLMVAIESGILTKQKEVSK